MKSEIYKDEGYKQPVGYLVNFGHKDTLEWKRFILSEFIQKLTFISAD
jgi:hypothetical protein